MIIDFLKTLSINECSTTFVRSSPPCIFVTVFTACPRCWQCKKVLWDGFVICSYAVLCFPSKYMLDHVKWKWFVKIWLGYFMVSFNQKTWLIMFCHGLPPSSSPNKKNIVDHDMSCLVYPLVHGWPCHTMVYIMKTEHGWPCYTMFLLNLKHGWLCFFMVSVLSNLPW